MLSIIIPTLNEEEYLPLLLESIKKQNHSDYEIIVADAGSKDSTIDIAKNYGCIVVEGGLLPRGRNNGARAAKGDIFLFLDADTILSPSFLNNSVDKFKKDDLGIAGFTVLPINGKKIDKTFFNFFNNYSKLTQKISPHAAGAILVKRKVHEAIGGFNEEIIFIEDYSYARAANRVAKFGLIKEPFFTSIRRYEKDGRIETYIRYALGELHIVFLGPIKSNIFNYKFGHYDSQSKTKN